MMAGMGGDEEPGDYPTGHLSSDPGPVPTRPHHESGTLTPPAIIQKAASTPEAVASGVIVSTPKQPITVETTAFGGAALPGLPSGSDFSLSTLSTTDGSQLFAASYEGLLPPPNHLREYDEIAPGAGREIISWVSAESNHRRQLDNKEQEHRLKLETRESDHRMALENKGMELGEKALDWGIFRANLGMLLAWPLVIGIVGAGTFLIYAGHDVAGATLAETALALVGGGYLLQRIERIMRAREGEPKAKPQEDPDSKDE
jgi:uncharacterized membrane protein